jgi:hypothetical protein
MSVVEHKKSALKALLGAIAEWVGESDARGRG